MVARTRLNVTLHVYCLFCYNLIFGVLYKGRYYKMFWNACGKQYGDFMLLEYVFNITIVFYILRYSNFFQIIYYYLLNKLAKGFTHT